MLASAGLLAFPVGAFAKKRVPAVVLKAGPHTLYKEQWPPAIQPDFLAVVDKGLALLSDQAGRLAIVNFKREQGPQVVGELSGIGKKIIDLTTSAHRCYAIANQEVQGESQNVLVTMSILPANDLTILSRSPLSYFTEPTAIAAGPDVVAIGGVAANGQNQVLLYSANPKRRPEEGAPPVSTLTFDSSVIKLDYQDRQLVVLQSSGTVTKLDVYNLSNVAIPVKSASLRFDGQYHVFSRSHDVMAIAGQTANRKFDVKLISMKPTAHVVSNLPLPIGEVQDIAVQRDQLLVLGNQSNRQVVIPVTWSGKNLAMTAGAPVMLPAGTRGVAAKAKIAANGKDAYVASDWGGVQVLNITKGGWEYLYSHTIPRLPAAAIAVSADRVVLGGADLKVYNISQPEHPTLLETTELGSAIRAVSLLGNVVLALTRDTLSLRNVDKVTSTIASAKVSGHGMAYDRAQQRAYVIAAKQKTTAVAPFRVTNTLTAERSIEVDGLYHRGAAEGGKVILCGLNNLAVFSTGDSLQLVGSREFPNLAIRDVAFFGSTAVITALDASSRGFLLVINTASPELNTIGSVDLPQDAVALAVSGSSAVVIGRGPTGKDAVSLVDLKNPSGPRVALSLPILEAASAVVIRDKLALVAGRGLEILSLT